MDEYEEAIRKERLAMAIDERRKRMEGKNISPKAISAIEQRFPDPTGFKSKAVSTLQTALNPFLNAGDAASALGLTLREGIPFKEALKAVEVNREDALIDNPNIEKLATGGGFLASLASPSPVANIVRPALARGSQFVKAVIPNVAEGAFQGTAQGVMSGESPVTGGLLGAGLAGGISSASRALPYVTGAAAGIRPSTVSTIPDALRTRRNAGDTGPVNLELPIDQHISEVARGIAQRRESDILNSQRKRILEQAENAGYGLPLENVRRMATEAGLNTQRWKVPGAFSPEVNRLGEFQDQLTENLFRDAIVTPGAMRKAGLNVANNEPIGLDELRKRFQSMVGDPERADQMAREFMIQNGQIGAIKLNALKRGLQEPPQANNPRPSSEEDLRTRIAGGLARFENDPLTGIPGMSEYNQRVRQTLESLRRMNIPVRADTQDPGAYAADITPKVASLIDKWSKGKLPAEQQREFSLALQNLGTDPNIGARAAAANLMAILGRGSIHGSRAQSTAGNIVRGLDLPGNIAGPITAGIGMAQERLAGPLTRSLMDLRVKGEDNPLVRDWQNSLVQGLARPATQFLNPEQPLEDEFEKAIRAERERQRGK